MQQIAESRGGECLSKKYINNHSRLTWQCKDGHIWKATPNNVKSGSWCSTCIGKAIGTIGQMRALAKEHGGKCLSKTYLNNSVKLSWQCKEGHVWQTTPKSIKKGSWCPVCYILRRKRKD